MRAQCIDSKGCEVSICPNWCVGHRGPILTAHALSSCDEQGKAVIMLLNPNPCPGKLKKGITVATWEPYESQPPLERGGSAPTVCGPVSLAEGGSPQLTAELVGLLLPQWTGCLALEWTIRVGLTSRL